MLTLLIIMKKYSKLTNYYKENFLYRKFKNQLKNDKVFNVILKTISLDNVYPINFLLSDLNNHFIWR